MSNPAHNSPHVLVLSDAMQPAHPKLGASAAIHPLHQALTGLWNCDAHVAPYTPSILARLKSESLEHGEYADMRALVFDLDDVEAKREGRPASDAWSKDVAARANQLVNALHTTACLYGTRGGARLVFLLPLPFRVHDHESAGNWQRFYLRAALYVREICGLEPDLACKDWTRLFRLPGVLRGGSSTHENWGWHWPAENIGHWPVLWFPPEIDTAAEARVSRKYRTNASRLTTACGDVLRALHARGMLGLELAPGKFNIMCPFNGGHSTGKPFDTSTVLFDGLPHGNIACQHASCANRSQDDFRAALGLGKGLRPILVAADEHRVLDEFLEVLPQSDYCHRNGELVEIIDEPAGPRIHVVNKANLRIEMSRLAHFYQETGRAEGQRTRYRVPPPDAIVTAVHQRAAWPGLRELRAVSRAPIFNQAGELVWQRALDPNTGVLVAPRTVGAGITLARPERAATMLYEPVSDFPFASESAFSAWISFVLTYFLQFAIEGPLPIFVFDANNAGSGKTLLATIGGFIGTGEHLTPQVLSPNLEEQRKLLTTIVRSGSRAQLFDNQIGQLGGPVLETLGTTRLWRDRQLGANQLYEGRVDIVTAVTGNNVDFRARDMVRRVVPIRLMSHEERPEERSGFKYPNILAHVREHQWELVSAAVSIVNHWIAAGRPEHPLKPFGAFEDWGFWVRNPLVWGGFGDPCESRKEIVSVDSETNALASLLSGISVMLSGERFTSAELVKRLGLGIAPDDAGRRALEQVTEALGSLDSVEATHSPSRLGRLFRKFRERTAGGRRLVQVGSRNGSAIWKVERVS